MYVRTLRIPSKFLKLRQLVWPQRACPLGILPFLSHLCDDWQQFRTHSHRAFQRMEKMTLACHWCDDFVRKSQAAFNTTCVCALFVCLCSSSIALFMLHHMRASLCFHVCFPSLCSFTHTRKRGKVREGRERGKVRVGRERVCMRWHAREIPRTLGGEPRLSR